MRDITFIHCGDIHLDARFTSTGMNDEQAKNRRQELRDAFSAIIDKAISYGVHMLFICGDLFEHEYMSRSTALFILQQLSRIPDVKVFISPGNHDPYVANSYYATLRWPDNVHIFKGTVEGVHIKELDTTVYGTGFINKQQYRSMLEGLNGIKKDGINILVTHGTVDGGQDDCPYHPINSQYLKALDFDYIALGHIHKHCKLDEERDSPKILYCGSPEPLGFDEPGEHGIILGSIGQKGTKTKFIPIGRRKCITVEIDVSGIVSMEEAEGLLKQKLEIMKEHLVRVIFTGRKNKDLEIDTVLMLARNRHHCYHLMLIDRTCPDIHLDDLKNQCNLKGIFVRNMLQEIEQTEDANKKEILLKALYMGLEAMDGRIPTAV
ncbi:MAG: DNA repair exonuclease [Clostridiaceae bacterium]|nr:DNA repair exonuclease [Clostridiaceae bacterium]